MDHQQWNTPPNGDFARYVEQLSARAAQSRRPGQEGDHQLDVGMTPAPEVQAQPGAVPGMQAPVRPAAAVAGLGRNLIKGLALAWLLVLVVLLAAGAPLSIVILLFGGGLWLAHKLRRVLLPPGIENWKQWLEEAAKKQQQLQQQRKNHSK
ncbi:hypothetical protein [Variovorax sp. JS1663]|uniref:hypothetical protein n=1 Tax=Variovorax sp. JS1663 TaxID=1851577 RepID=UPI000B3412C7|nr:hypothetical protein [Variovorax sp. JS1663]OUM01043.1 hypothetical protein A8M77_18240 [Variovorax sp. JS1663]